jgi:hypothetical protein
MKYDEATKKLILEESIRVFKMNNEVWSLYTTYSGDRLPELYDPTVFRLYEVLMHPGVNLRYGS